MYCICCSNILSWRKVTTHELQLLYLKCQRGEQNNGSSSHWGLIFAPVKSKRRLIWRQILQLDLPALSLDESHSKDIHTMSLLSVQFTHGCFRILNLNFHWILITLSRDTLHITRTYPSSVGEAGLFSTSLYQRRQRCYHNLWSSLHR